jgi:hypothetical protein
MEVESTGLAAVDGSKRVAKGGEPATGVVAPGTEAAGVPSTEGEGKGEDKGSAPATAATGTDFEGITIADHINEHLPPHIRVFTVQKVGSGQTTMLA